RRWVYETGLLQSYGVDSEAYQVTDKSASLSVLSTPFMAQVDGDFVVVRTLDPRQVTFTDGSGADHELGRDAFCNEWSGVAFLAYPSEKASEPDLEAHRFTEIGNHSKRWILLVAVVTVFVYLFVSRHIYAHVSTVLLTVINLAGLYITYELVLKSLHIESRHGDDICGMIDRNGCRSVLDTSASKFFGLFGWSEVGFSYFGVSLAALLLFPQHIGTLALVNACCCPFSFWSVWYQKYRAKAWCTLCLITQACLWLSLACYIFGGAFSKAWPPSLHFVILCAVYVSALLVINALMPAFDKSEKK
ncbi:MAG: hypothetical protein K2J38_03125, partial [Muribaculaceae bacterium]|nr:hypothetical protein [Muribaculaceae bacterium]